MKSWHFIGNFPNNRRRTFDDLHARWSNGVSRLRQPFDLPTIAAHDSPIAMKLSSLLLLLLLIPSGGAAEPISPLPPAATRDVDFAKDIQPLFQKNCYSCHGPEHQEGG